MKLKTQIVMKPNNSNCDRTEKFKLGHNSNCDRTQIVTKLKNIKRDKTHSDTLTTDEMFSGQRFAIPLMFIIEPQYRFEGKNYFMGIVREVDTVKALNKMFCYV